MSIASLPFISVRLASAALGVALITVAGCNSSNNSPSQVKSPGGDKTAKSHMLEHGADMLQDMPTIKAINMYLNGIHFYADDLGRQVEAHHYCNMLNQDVHQCVIYDGNTATSKTTPSTRPSTSAWLETSIAQPTTPSSRISANRPWRSGASGVVSAVRTSTPAIRVPTVPTTADRIPADSSPPSSSRVTVVLPCVPVTPTIRSAAAGLP